MNAFSQLPLPLRFDQTCNFEHYYCEHHFVSHTVKKHIKKTEEPLLVVKGGESTGKSHVLNAAALYCQQKKIPFQYFEANMLLEYGVDIVAPCQQGDVVIIDDVQLLAQHTEWERKLYDMYNDAQRYNWLLIISVLSNELSTFLLHDWASRIKAGIHLGLDNVDEEKLKNIIKLRSKLMGLKIKPDVIEYLLGHYSRNLSEQISILKILDQSALEQQRNITIPFVKEILS